MKIDGPKKYIIVLNLLEGKPSRKNISLTLQNMLLKLQNELLKLLMDNKSVSFDLIVVSENKTVLRFVQDMFEKMYGDRFEISLHSMEFSATYVSEFRNDYDNDQDLLSLAYDKLPSIIEDIVNDKCKSALEVPVLNSLSEFPVWYFGVEYILDVDERQSWQEYFDCSDFESMVPLTQKQRAKTWFHLISSFFNQYDCDNWIERNEFAMKVAQFVAVFHLLEAASAHDWNNLDGEKLLKLPFDSLWVGIMANDLSISLEEYYESFAAEAAIVERLAIQNVSEAIAELCDIFFGASALLFVFWFSIYPDYSDSSLNKFIRIGEDGGEDQELRQVWLFIDSGNIGNL